MDRTLLLMRHANADWPPGLTNDIDRPLSARGNKDAAKIGCWIKENNLVPSCIRSSYATRAFQTTTNVCQQLNIEKERIVQDERIYNTTRDQLLSIVQETDNTIIRLLIVGHNPTFSDTLKLLCQRTPQENVEYSMPTACLAVISFKCFWHEVGKDSGQLNVLVSPGNFPQ
ncbi:MAG: hypothetical protein CL398_11785 [Acidiferrobacteraceae bacterium]|nr:hypothetical protein [Acidiferrobacteraceae bacterium]